MSDLKNLIIENDTLIRCRRAGGAVTVPEGVTAIGKGAFADLVDLTAVRLPDGLRTVGEYAFAGCTGLGEVNLPEGVEEIGAGAFTGCGMLTAVTLPKSLKKLGREAFRDCARLTEINVAAGNKTFRFENGLLIRRKEVLCWPMGRAGAAIVPEGVQKIARLAFAACKGVTEIILPDSVTEIGGEAFTQCKNLRRLRLSRGLTKVGSGMACGCDALTEIDLPDSLTDIGEYTFSESGLTSLAIPAGVTIVRRRAFAVCRDLREVTVAGDTELAYEVFARSGVETLRLGKGKLVSSTFEGCDRLTAVYAQQPLAALPKGEVKDAAIMTAVRRIASGEERSEEVLKYIKNQRRHLFPMAVREPELLRFMAAEGMLTAKDYPLLLAEAEAQQNTAAKAAILEYQNRAGGPPDPFEEMEEAYKKAERVAAYIEKNGTLPVSELKKIWSYRKNPDGTITVTSYKGEESEVTVPDVIGKSPVTAIEGTFGLYTAASEKYMAVRRAVRRVTLPKGLKRIGAYSFSGCGQLQSIQIPEGVTEIGERAFQGCKSLRRLVLPAPVRKIGGHAFAGCAGLTAFAVPEGVGVLPDYAFNECRKLSDITLPAGLTEIGMGAFDKCAALRNVVLPDAVAVMGSGVFRECAALIRVVLPASLRLLSYSTFASCSALRWITVPQGVTEISSFVFYNCRSLERVTLPGSVTDIADKAFEHNTRAAIQAPLGSAAEAYARKYRIKFEPMEETAP